MKKNRATRRRGAGRLSAEEAAKLGDRLLDAAEELFAQKGFKDVTMDEIARKAGSSTQTIYSRYPGKAEMLEAVVSRVVQRTVAAHSAATSSDPRAAPPRAYLTSLGDQIVRSINSDGGGLTRLAFAEAHRFPELRRLADDAFGRGAGLISRALEAWASESVLSPATDPDLTAGICLSMMSDRARVRAAFGDAFSEEEAGAYIGEAVEIFLNGVAGGEKRSVR